MPTKLPSTVNLEVRSTTSRSRVTQKHTVVIINIDIAHAALTYNPHAVTKSQPW
jgi:hypothetical protein